MSSVANVLARANGCDEIALAAIAFNRREIRTTSTLLKAELGDGVECPDQILVELGPHIEQKLVSDRSGQRRLVRSSLDQGAEYVALLL